MMHRSSILILTYLFTRYAFVQYWKKIETCKRWRQCWPNSTRQEGLQGVLTASSTKSHIKSAIVLLISFCFWDDTLSVRV
uniref:Secreted protein n=1 Tax=Arundo donax TaxID=35708 RepID=A0A0A8ZE73_ARUDO